MTRDVGDSSDDRDKDKKCLFIVEYQGFPLEFDCVYLRTSVRGSIDVSPVDVPGF